MYSQSPEKSRNLVKRYRWFIGAGLFFLLYLVLMLNSETVVRLIDVLIPRGQLSWPTVQGTILGTNIHCRVPFSGESRWVVKVYFAYQVRETEYSNEQEVSLIEAVSLSDLDAGSTRDNIVRVLNSACGGGDIGTEVLGTVQKAARGRLLYNMGQPALIYYNPKKPSEGVIKPGLVLGGDLSYGEVFQLYTSLILCVGGIGLLIVGLRIRK
jgi:hypothetical protein